MNVKRELKLLGIKHKDVCRHIGADACTISKCDDFPARHKPKLAEHFQVMADSLNLIAKRLIREVKNGD